MADISRIKRNIKKMIDAGAPEEDIDSYLSTENVSIEDLKSGSSKSSVTQEQEEIPKVPTVKEAFLGANEQVAGAVRGFVQGKGIKKGFEEPESIPSYQEAGAQLATEMGSALPPKIAGLMAYQQSLQLQAAGKMADALFNPISIAGGYIGKAALGALASKPVVKLAQTALSTPPGKIISKAGNVIGKVINAEIAPIKWAKNLLYGKKTLLESARKQKSVLFGEIDEATKFIKNIKPQKTKILDKYELAQKNVIESEKETLANALIKAEQKIGRKVNNQTVAEIRKIKEELPLVYKEKSAEFGSKLDEILKANPIEANTDELVPIFEKALNNHSIIDIADDGAVTITRSPITPGEKNVFNMYKRLKANPNTPISTSELMASQNVIKPKFGKAWNSGEHLQSEVSTEISKIVSEKVPEVANLRKNYKPFLDWKEEMNNTFKPFKNKYNITSSSKSLVKKIGSVNE